MIEIKTLEQFSEDEYFSFDDFGYSSDSRFDVVRNAVERNVSFEMNLRQLSAPYNKLWPKNKNHYDSLKKMIEEKTSFGAFDGIELIGFVITNPMLWNNSVWIELIHINSKYRKKGIGSALLESLERHSSLKKFRMIEFETQNTNPAAINFYRKNKYEIAGLHMTLYDRKDAKEEIAIYMSKHLNH